LKTDNLIHKLFIPFFLILITVGFISISGLYYSHQSHIFHIALDNFEKISSRFDKKFENDINSYATLIKLLSKDKEAIKIFKTDNREALYQYYKETYQSLNKTHNISHFYFHKKNKINFLRIHNPKKHSDLINRSTLNQSIKTSGLGKGIEFGIFHNLTLRVVYPWFVNNEIIGYIELGKEIDYFIPELAKIENSEVIFTITKDLISKENYENWLKHSKTNIHFEELKNYYIIDSSIGNINLELKKILNSDKNIHNKYIDYGNSIFHVHSTAFNDISGEEIGKLYIFSDLTEEYSFLFTLLYQLCILIFVLFLISAVIYYRIIRKSSLLIDKRHNHMVDLSNTDALTQLYNKRFYDNNIPLLIQKAIKDKKHVSFLIIDIDFFKNYNDYYGHKKGDFVIQKVANEIRKSFQRKEDYCFRIGGEEFAVFIELDDDSIGLKRANVMKENIQKLQIEHLKNQPCNVITVSVGLHTMLASEIENYDFLFNQADKALYLSKNSGRNQVSEI